MKQYKYLYQKMLEDSTIRKAYKKLRKGKTKRKEVRYIDEHLDEEVDRMKEMIMNTRPCPVDFPEKAYRPRNREPKIIEEHGKKRKIYVPEIHEQWLHHIIVLVLDPIITATAYPFSCGSLPGKGAHYGKRQIERWICKGKEIKYFAKLDIRHFYDSIKADVLFRELGIRIKDDWFLHIIKVCLSGLKGLPLGFYISQWLANYILEPLDMLITKSFHSYARYMDDMAIFGRNKKELHKIISDIKMLIGQRLRLKLKCNFQVCKFDFTKKNGQAVGRPLDFMGFVFFRGRTIIRKGIMLSATRLAARMDKSKSARRGYYRKHIQAMLSYVGWFSHSDTYWCFQKYIKPYINVGKLKKIASKLDRREDKNDRMEKGALCGAA